MGTTARLVASGVMTGVIATGCSSAEDAPAPAKTDSTTNTCVTPGASYVVQFVERSGGTCGGLPDAVINVSPEGTVPVASGCTGTPRNEGCDVVLSDISCPSAGGGTVTQTGKVTWAEDGASGAGTLQFTVKLGSGETCISSYDVTYTRQ